MSHINVMNVEYKAHGYELDFFFISKFNFIRRHKMAQPKYIGSFQGHSIREEEEHISRNSKKLKQWEL
jgi:hypothetical protein